MVLTACVCWSVFMHWRCPWTPAALIQSHLAVWHNRNSLLPARSWALLTDGTPAPGRRWAWQTQRWEIWRPASLLRKECCPSSSPHEHPPPCTGWSAPPPSVSLLPVTITHPAHSLMWPPPHFLAVSRLALSCFPSPMKEPSCLFVL